MWASKVNFLQLFEGSVSWAEHGFHSAEVWRHLGWSVQSWVWATNKNKTGRRWCKTDKEGFPQSCINSSGSSLCLHRCYWTLLPSGYTPVLHLRLGCTAYIALSPLGFSAIYLPHIHRARVTYNTKAIPTDLYQNSQERNRKRDAFETRYTVWPQKTFNHLARVALIQSYQNVHVNIKSMNIVTGIMNIIIYKQ